MTKYLKLAEAQRLYRMEAAERAEQGRYDLPIYGLPQPIQAYIEDVANSYQCCQDIVTAAVMTTAATALGAKCVFRNKSYENTPTMWTIFIARSGANKTAPVKEVLRPLDAVNRRYIREYKDAKNNAEPGEDCPPYKRIKISDTTPEARYKLLQYNTNGILYYRDEIRGLFDDMGRYSKKSGEGSAMLSVYDNTAVEIDRKGDEPITIERPMMNIMGSVQPEIIGEFLSSKEYTASGFTNRFFCIYPRPEDMPRKEYLKARTVTASERLMWQTYIESCVNAEPMSYTLDPGAEKRIYAPAVDSWSDKAADPETSDYHAAMYSKAAIKLIRLAGLVQAMNDISNGHAGGEGVIGADAMSYALDCMEYYFIPMDIKLGELLLPREDMQISKADLIKILRKQNPKGRQNAIAEAVGVTEGYVSRILKS